MSGRAQVGGQGSYRGHLGWNLWSELAFPGRTGTMEELGMREGDMVQTPTPPSPTKTDKDSGVSESEVREGGQVTKPTPPTKTDTDSGAVVIRVGVT